jgi:hypothetical protein
MSQPIHFCWGISRYPQYATFASHVKFKVAHYLVIYACPSVPTDGVYCNAGYYFLQTASIVFLQDSMLILSIPSAGVPAYHASARALRTTLAAILRLAGR